MQMQTLQKKLQNLLQLLRIDMQNAQVQQKN